MRITSAQSREFEKKYTNHLYAADRPSCYVAYIRAEADYHMEHSRRKYASYDIFRKVMSRRRARDGFKKRLKKNKNAPNGIF
jgi:hypothetical protein